MKGWFRKKIVLGQCSVHKDAEMFSDVGAKRM